MTKQTDLKILGLGILVLIVSSFCDNLRAPILPLLKEAHNLTHLQSSGFLSIGYFASFCFSLFSTYGLTLWGDRAFLLWALAFQLAALVLAAWTPSYLFLLASGFLWGMGTIGLGTISNLLVLRATTEENRTRSLSGLHAFYGVASMLPAFYVGMTVDWGWRLWVLILVPGLLPLLLFGVSLSFLSKGEAPPEEGSFDLNRLLSWDAMALNLSFSGYVLGEVLTSMWLVTFLHQERGMGIPAASRILGWYFMALALSRFLLFLFGSSRSTRTLPACSLGFGGLFLLLAVKGWTGAFILAGFAFGPFFPSVVSSLPEDYPKNFRSMLAFFFSVMMLSVSVGNLIMGKLSDAFTLQQAFTMPAMCLFAGLAIYLARAWMRKRLKPIEHIVNTDPGE